MAGERRHKPYREFLLGEPCCCYPCTASVVIHHNTFGQPDQHSKSIPGKRGKGQRASDDEGMPLCNHHHRQLHDLSGYFGGWDKTQLRTWQDAQVQRLRNTYAMRHPEPCPAPVMPSPSPRRARAVAPGREAFLQEVADWAGNKRLKDHEHQLIHDLINDLRATGAGSEF
jgi:hypothetical protein